MTDRTMETLHSQKVDISDVERSITELWKNADNAKSEGSAIVRACGLTVIGIAGSDQELASMSAQIGIATGVVPARTLIVHTGVDVEGGLSAEISAFCTLPGPGRKQVCHEQVLIQVSDARVDDIPALISPLSVPDLPLVLVLANISSLRGSLVQRLILSLDVLIVDSSRCLDCGSTYREMLRIHDEKKAWVRDLAFERLAAWRDSIANAYDEILQRGERIMAVEATCIDNDAEGSLLLGWIESRFARNERPYVRLDRSSDSERGFITSIRLTVGQGGESRTVEFEQRGRHVIRLDSHHEASHRQLPRPTPDDHHLLARILADPQSDRVYDETLLAVVERFGR